MSDAQRFFELLNSSESNVEDLYIINDNILEVIVKKNKEFVKESNVTNIFIAVFTTSHARLLLYDLLEKNNRRIIYFDTDSVFFISRPNDIFQPQLSPFLGGLCCEITKEHGPGHYIQQFYSTGPKSYSYVVSNGSRKVCIKGFTLNYRNSQLLNMDSVKELIAKMAENQSVTIRENKILREKVSRKVVNREQTKTYQVVYDKRIILEAGKDTIPYGYHWQPTNHGIVEDHVQPYNLNALNLYSEHYISNENTLGELFPYDNTENPSLDSAASEASDIDLMATSESDESSDELSCRDLEFLDDNEEGQGPSFYIALEN